MRRKDYVESLYTKYVGQSFELTVQIYHSHKNRTENRFRQINGIMIVIMVKNDIQEKLQTSIVLSTEK